MRIREHRAKWLVIGLCIASCRQQPQLHQLPVSDLLAEFGRAESIAESGRIDLGTAAARAHLGDGWSWNEIGRDGKSFVWGTRESSELFFYLHSPRALRIEVRCLPLRRAERSVEAIGIDLNGQPVAEVALQGGWRRYSFGIAADLLTSGLNRLQFDYRWSSSTVDASPAGGRPVAVAWDWIDLGGASDRLPSAVGEEGLLILPPRSQVDYYLELPGPSELWIDRIATDVDADTEPDHLEITLTSEDGTTRVFEFAGPVRSDPVRWPLTDRSTLARLRFRSSGDSVLERPRIVHTGSSGTALEAAEPRTARGSPPRPDLIVVYLIDTLRADHTGLGGYPRQTTPNLDRWLGEAVVFEETLAPSSWTKPSVASLLTGQLPWTHGAEGDRSVLPRSSISMPEYFRRLGFRTAGFSANGYVAPAFGFDRGFEHFEMMPVADSRSDQVQARALAWLDGVEPDEPAFLYLQTIDPHTPYQPPATYRGRFATDTPDPQVGSVSFMRALARSRQEPEPSTIRDLIDLYDAEIVYNDEQLGRFLTALRQTGRYDDALVVVASDHGEEFFEHGGLTHARSLHAEVLRVPFAIRFPRGWAGGTRVEERVQLIDLLPTLLESLGQPIPPELPGRSLLYRVAPAPADTGTATEPRPAFSSVHYHANHWVGVVWQDWKLLIEGQHRLAPQTLLFDLGNDPHERVDLAERFPFRVGHLASLIRQELQRQSPTAVEQVELDDETRERLRALGYLD